MPRRDSFEPDPPLPFADTELADGQPDAFARALVDAQPRAEPGIGVELLRARVLAMATGQQGAVHLGRFRILDRLGHGGMGVVYRAHDPDLERDVAIKVINVPARGRDEALAEAKALARLSDENVVPVHEVGFEGDELYIVMELVKGKTLRRWVDGRSWREIVAVFRQAGAGLAAAHAAGLIHRDFKPENAIVGDDGRVRVVDFGLACEATDAGRGLSAAGTPAYMAPEQRAGAALTHAADQFSFCVALAEALAGQTRSSPPPRWLTAVLARGRSESPEARFPSMDALLRELSRDPARTRRIAIVGGAVVVAAAVTAYLVGEQRASEARACTGGEAEVDRVLPAAIERGLLATIAAKSEYGRDVAARARGALAEHARSWAAAHRDACLAHRRGTQPQSVFTQRTSCLARGLAARARVAEILEGSADGDLSEIARATAALPDPQQCGDVQLLASDLPPPPARQHERVAALGDRIAAVRVDIAAGRMAVAAEAARRCVDEARAIGYEPLLAEALLVLGRAKMTDDLRAAQRVLAEATATALRTRADAVAIEAWARKAWARAMTGDIEHATDGRDLIEAVVARTPTARFERALLENNLGSVALARDDRAGAQRAFERAVADADGVTGPGAIELVNARVNLALSIDDGARRQALLAEAEAHLDARLGPDHPDVLNVRWIRGTVGLERLADVRGYLEAVCRGYDLHAPLVAKAATCWAEVAQLDAELGDLEDASVAMERARARANGDPAAVAEADGYLALWDDDAALARERFAAAAAHVDEGGGPPWWRDYRRAETELGRARALRALGAERDARRALEAIVQALVVVTQRHPAPRFERRLGRARIELTRALRALGAPERETRPVAAAAVSWLRRVDGPASTIVELDEQPR